MTGRLPVLSAVAAAIVKGVGHLLVLVLGQVQNSPGGQAAVGEGGGEWWGLQQM